MSRHRPQSAEASGQDSFLDIVANLVGILIILVMVIGVRAKDAMLEAAPIVDEPEVVAALPAIDVEGARRAAAAVEQDIQNLQAKIHQESFEVEYRRKERDKIQMLISSAQAAISSKRDELNEEQQRAFDSQQQLADAQTELQTLESRVRAAEGTIPQTAIIEHLPTPMAKTVFGRELHFRLASGRLTYVPWDELVNKLQDEARQKMWRLKEEDRVTETIGPVGGFMMRYQLVRVQQTINTRAGASIQNRVELDNFVLIPTDETLGDPIEEALLEGSRLQSILAANDPEKTTLTIWTYPDSFDAFRELKQELFRRSYLTASRPMPEGTPIGGSPRGTRSAAQ